MTPRLSLLPLTLASCGFTALVVLSALWLAPERSNFLFLAALGAFALVFLLILPVHVLPLVALLVVFTVSDRIADFSLFPLVTPPVAVLLVWLLRKGLSRQQSFGLPTRLTQLRLGRLLLLVNVLMALWLLVLMVLSPTRLGFSWSLTYVVAVVVPLVVKDTARETLLLRAALPWVGAVAALYAVAQASLQSNLIYSVVLRSLGREAVAQHWAVYRSDGSFGHPLIAGLFFAVVLSGCIGRWLETQRPVLVLLAAASGAGIISSVSRGSYIAAGLSVVAVIALSLVGRGHAGRGRALLLLAGCLAFAYIALHTTSYLDRAASQEASDSSLVRANLPSITYETASRYHWLGSGPATSLVAAAPFNTQGLRIENSYFQALISLGVPGLLLFVGTLGLFTVVALRLRNFGSAGALMALAIGLSGFAALDGLRNVLVMLGLLAMLALHRDPEPALPDLARGVGAAGSATGGPLDPTRGAPVPLRQPARVGRSVTARRPARSGPWPV